MKYSLSEYRQMLQCKPHWCWAAMAVSLVRYHYRNYPDNPASRITQCELAGQLLNLEGCCPAPDGDGCDLVLDCDLGTRLTSWCEGPEACDTGVPDESALFRYLADQHQITYKLAVVPRLSRIEIEEQIKAGWPVFIIRIDGSGAEHVLAVVGIDDNRLHILDSEGYCKSATFEGMLQIPDSNGALHGYLWIRTYHHV